MGIRVDDPVPITVVVCDDTTEIDIEGLPLYNAPGAGASEPRDEGGFDVPDRVCNGYLPDGGSLHIIKIAWELVVSPDSFSHAALETLDVSKVVVDEDKVATKAVTNELFASKL